MIGDQILHEFHDRIKSTGICVCVFLEGKVDLRARVHDVDYDLFKKFGMKKIKQSKTKTKLYKKPNKK